MPERFDLLRQSYEEVLDATKHQDDKIGRFLSAIAFIIAGALVFADPSDPRILRVRYAVADVELELPAIALMLFLGLTVLTVLFLMLGLTAPLTRPTATKTSHLFFLMIAGQTERNWKDMWPEDVRKEIEEDYLREIPSLARRADRKYARGIEASALFVLALLFFLVGLVLSIESLAAQPISDSTPQVFAWTLRLRVEVGAILASFAFTLSYQEMRRFQNLDDWKRGRRVRLRGSQLMLAAYPLAVALTIASDSGWWPSILVSGALATIGLRLTTAGEAEDGKQAESSPGAIVQTGFAGIFFGAAAWAAAARRPDLQLLVAIFALFPLLFGSFWQASAEWKKRREQLGTPSASPRGTASSGP